MTPTRINKYLADQGLCSRREADKLIASGQVLINGQVAKLGEQVSESDRVELKASRSQLPAKSYFAYHKPRGLATEDIKGPENTYPLGRLDKDSEGLLLFTNDGRLTKKILGGDVEKEYQVEVDKKIDGLDLKRMGEGLRLEGKSASRTKPAAAKKLGENLFQIVLTEGKKHQIRRMCAALGYQVRSLKRLRVGKIRLGGQAPGTFRPLKWEQI